MNHSYPYFRPFVYGLLTVFSLLFCPEAMALQGREIPDIEKFALASDREAVLANLVPGSEEDYYLRSLHGQNLGHLEAVEELLTRWKKQYGETVQWRSIRSRQALLKFDTDPVGTTDYLKTQFNLSFNHQRRLPPAAQNLPVALEPSVIDRNVLIDRDIRNNRDLSRLSDAALYHLSERVTGMDIWQKRQLLARIQFPDFPGVVELVLQELRDKDSPGFGNFAIHRLLTKEQLQQCLSQMPELGNSSQFVQNFVLHLYSEQIALPNYWQTRISDLDRIIAFLRPLPPSQNSLKAATIHERLRLGSQQAEYDLALFLEYLQLPRNSPYLHQRLLQSLPSQDRQANLSENFQSVLFCPPPNDDSPLVTEYLQHFLQDANAISKFTDLIEKDFLNAQLAIAQVLKGAGDASRWSAILGPGRYRELVQRIDLEFGSVDKLWYQPEDKVSVSLRVKNVDEIVVRIFELNTLNCYRESSNSISADLSLDGLVPNHERRIKRKQVPAIQSIENVELPELDHRGVYIVDFIGGGKNCRALVRKGRLTCTTNLTVDGHEFTVLDENNAPLEQASVWVGGRKFDSADGGKIFVPFSNSPGEQPVIIEHAGFADLASANIASEAWTMSVQMHIDRESLIPGQDASILLRPSLSVAGVPVPAAGSLKNVSLQMTVTTLDGDNAVKTFRDLVVNELGEIVVDFLVPERLRTLNLTMTGDVRVRSQNSDQQLAGSTSFSVNRIDSTAEIVCPHLIRNRDQYVIELLGRNGESRGEWPVALKLYSIWSNDPVDVTLQTDKSGRLVLGQLKGISTFTATINASNSQGWSLNGLAFQTLPNTLTVQADEEFRVPAPASLEGSDIAAPHLFRLSGQLFQEELTEYISVADGWMNIDGLSSGDYLLKTADGQQIRIWSVEGQKTGVHLVNDRLDATLPTAPSPTIAGVTEDNNEIRIRVDGATASTRVHLMATRYVPAFPVATTLGGLQDAPPMRRFHRWDSNRYVSARNLGDEYLYILNRQTLERLPGNMLERPSLLLAPWSLGPTENQSESLAGDDAMKPGAAMDSAASAEGSERGPGGGNLRDDFANLEFLESGTILLDNMRPDKDGVVRIDFKDLGDKHQLTIAVVDLFSTTVHSHALAVKELKSQDRRLVETLAVDQHLSLEKRIEVQTGEKVFVVGDILTSRFEAVDDLGDAWKLLAASCDDPELSKFAFIVRWNQMNDGEKRTQYEDHACHELNYFLYRKDRKFFDAVIQPLIRNRHWPTFMDQYLLGMDLGTWLTPWRFEQLNTFEQILLAQQLAEQRPGILRHVDEQSEMLPPDELMMDGLFEAAIAGSSLDGEDARRQLLEEYKSVDKEARTNYAFGDPATAAPGAANAPSESAAPGRGVRGAGGGGDGDGSQLRDELKKLSSDLESDRKDIPGTEGKVANLRRMLRRGELQGAKQEEAEKALALYEKRSESGESHGLVVANDEFFSGRAGEAGKELSYRGYFYQAIKPTERWVEYGYWRIRQIESAANRIGVNRFWRQFAGQGASDGFLSPDFVQCHRNLSDVILALAVLDLPETAKEPKLEFADREMRWTADKSAIVFHQQLRPLPTDPGATRVMVSENFFDAADRYQTVNNRQMDKFVSGKYYTDKLYGAQAVVTNPTSTPQSVSLLVQIPKGAIAVASSRETKTMQLELPAFGSASHEYWFYFPGAGDFEHFPAHVAAEDMILAWANTTRFEVVDEQARADRESWEFVSQNGSDEELLAWMAAKNLQQVNLADIAFRMQNRVMFERVTQLLANRFVYNPVLWSYSVFHQEAKRIGEYLENEENFVRQCGPVLDSSLIAIQPELRRWYEQVEFSPLVNARAHQVGANRMILNDQLLQQYSELLGILAARANRTDDDKMAVVYFLLLQDRVHEAIEWFGSIDPAKVAGQMQYDYAKAWLAVSQSDTEAAAKIASNYTSHPMARWRNRFAAIASVVQEAGGQGTKIVDPDIALQQQTEQAASMPSLSVESTTEGLQIDYRNLKAVTVDYHEMDVELLFSRDPFNSGGRSGHTLVRPNMTESVELPAGETRLVHKIPESIQRKNVIAEIRGGDQVISQTIYSNNLDVQMVPAMGQLQVRTRSDGKVLPASYVKVFAETNSGEVVFFKDGYTDIRGRFDYVTQSNYPLDNVVRFGVLVLSDEHGCMIRTAEMPRR